MKVATSLLVLLTAPAFGAVKILSIAPSEHQPQPIGTAVTWTVKATDSGAGQPMFQFNVAQPHGRLALVKDFNVGTSPGRIWTSQPFVWVPTGFEGVYQINVVIEDFTSGESVSKTVKYRIKPLVTAGAPVVAATANPLVALFSAPACPAGSQMRVSFQEQSGSVPAVATNWAACHPPLTMTFEIAGMYPSTAYEMFSQTQTGTQMINGPTVDFTTGALPSNVIFPNFTTLTAAGAGTGTTDWMMVWGVTSLANPHPYPDVATDLSGKIVWYYVPSDADQSNTLTRPLAGGHMLTLEDGPAWNPASQQLQLLREIDLAGNIVRETNTGIIQEQLVAMGAADAAACNSIAKPAPIGSACLGSFHHDAIQTLPNGYTAVWTDIEKIFPPGTQGDTSGLPVDIFGDMIVVLNADWQVVWYFDTFEHDSGPPQLDIARAAVLGETCTINQAGCPPTFLLGTGIAPEGKDWLHANCLYYWPQEKDIIWSSKDQDWVMKVDYRDGKGTGNIIWRMGLDGDFTFNNINSDPYPWFSHQHDVGIENSGAGPMTLFDNGDTRVAMLGSGSSRGMALTFDEATMTVTPVLSASLGYYGPANGSAQLLSNGNYFFDAAFVSLPHSQTRSFAIELGAGNAAVLNIEGPNTNRVWRMPSLYAPPIT